MPWPQPGEGLPLKFLHLCSHVAESLHIPEFADRAERYRFLQEQIPFLMDPPAGAVANLSNAMALLYQVLEFHWIGIYLVREVEGKQQLVLGPFQGPVACTRIAFGKGVCGTAWQQQQSIIVPDVDQFPGHIACSSLSRSEIVLPLRVRGEVAGVLDIDSIHLDDFSEIDRRGLQVICELLEGQL